MAKPKVSSKDLQKTPKAKKEKFYLKEQTDYGKNKNQGNTNNRGIRIGYGYPKGFNW